MKNVFEHGRKFGITFYDAVYVTLVEKEDCKLITADAKLQRNVGGAHRCGVIVKDDKPRHGTDL
ncbi:hypothetical protein C5S29_12255 [ANME-1 cluster archaeon GoMg3.2]|nr:hypothetical protein [ANME-1 cluster archaeon GoMg3.2]